jgi:hypothetical protein
LTLGRCGCWSNCFHRFYGSRRNGRDTAVLSAALQRLLLWFKSELCGIHQTFIDGSPVYSILTLPQKQLPVGIFAFDTGSVFYQSHGVVGFCTYEIDISTIRAETVAHGKYVMRGEISKERHDRRRIAKFNCTSNVDQDFWTSFFLCPGGNRRPMTFRTSRDTGFSIVFPGSSTDRESAVEANSPMSSNLLLLLIVPSSKKNPARNTGYPRNELIIGHTCSIRGSGGYLLRGTVLSHFLLYSSITETCLRMSNTGTGVDKSYSGRSGHVIDSLSPTFP